MREREAFVSHSKFSHKKESISRSQNTFSMVWFFFLTFGMERIGRRYMDGLFIPHKNPVRPMKVREKKTSTVFLLPRSSTCGPPVTTIIKQSFCCIKFHFSLPFNESFYSHLFFVYSIGNWLSCTSTFDFDWLHFLLLLLDGVLLLLVKRWSWLKKWRGNKGNGS